MYPETDVPPLRVDEKLLEEANKLKPKTPEELLNDLCTKHGLSKELAKQLIKDPSLPLYLVLTKELGNLIKPQLIATTLLIYVKGLKSEGLDVDMLTIDDIKKVLKAVGSGKIAKEAIPEVLAAYLRGKVRSVEDSIKMFTRVSSEELEELIRKVIEENRSIVHEKGMKAFGLVMGKVMSVVRGRVDGKLVADVVKRILQEYVISQKQ